MTVLVVERAPPRLRGRLTRWMLEVKAGVYVGTLSSRVREHLWDHVRRENAAGGSVLVYRCLNEQGFAIECHGDPSRQLVDLDGLQLVLRP